MEARSCAGNREEGRGKVGSVSILFISLRLVCLDITSVAWTAVSHSAQGLDDLVALQETCLTEHTPAFVKAWAAASTLSSQALTCFFFFFSVFVCVFVYAAVTSFPSHSGILDTNSGVQIDS